MFNDTVYFCGVTWYRSTSQAVWGYFPLAGFPSVNVKYIVRSMDWLSKIDVFSIDPTMNEVHVVMVGRLNSDKGIMVDEVRTAPDQFIEYTGLVDDIEEKRFSDVAVTDNYVVMTMHDGGTYFAGGEVLFINKPTTMYTTIFLCTARSYSIPQMNSTSGLLEYCKNDAVVVAYEGSFGNVGVHSFIGYTPHSHLKILMPQFNVYDIKFDEVSEDLDILVRPFKFATKVADSSMILHLNQSLVSYGGPLFCHKYMDERLNSLDWIPWEKNCFVASGHDVGGSHLRAYKYYYNNWGNCTQQQILQAVPLEKKDVVSEKLIYDECEVEMLELESYEMATPLTIICE